MFSWMKLNTMNINLGIFTLFNKFHDRMIKLVQISTMSGGRTNDRVESNYSETENLKKTTHIPIRHTQLNATI